MSRRHSTVLTFVAIGIAFAIGPRSGAADRSKADSFPAAVAERIRWIEEARRDNPELFDKVARCYELVFSPRGDILGRADYHLRGFILDVLHPDYRDAMQAHPDVYAAIKAEFDRALERVEAFRKQHPGLAPGPRIQGIWKDYDAELKRIMDSSSLPRWTLGLIAGAVKPPEAPRLDPVTLPAWEAALLDPRVPWVAKGLVGRIVARFEDPGSTPVLGWFLRDAGHARKECRENGPVGPGYLKPEDMKRRQGAGAPLDPCEDPLVAGSIVAGEFEVRPREDIAMELIAVLRDADDPAGIRRWGERLRSSSRWMRLLEELAEDPDKAAQLRPLLEEVGLEAKKKSDSTRDPE